MKLRYQRGNAELAALIVVVLLVLVGFWVHARITEFATAINVDFDTSSSVVLRMAVAVVIFSVSLWQGFFLKAIPYLPFVLLAVFVPALNYWAANAYSASYGGDAAWYGSLWIQVIGAIALLGMGALGHKWVSENI